MALSKTDICNQALARVGGKTIMDIDDDEAKNARVCKNVFEAVVREVGRQADWNCLKARSELGQLSTAPAFGWDYQYQLPSDFLRLTHLNGIEYHGQVQDEYEIEGTVLLTDAESAKVQYIKYSEDTPKWDALFTNAVVVLLASRIAVPLRQDENMAQALLTEYERIALPQARKTDANERKLRRYDPCSESRFIASRYKSTNG